MNPAENPGAAPAQKRAKARRGVVLIAVLVIVASLSLAGYQFSDMMTSEYKGSENSHRMAQARRFAESGVFFAAANLSNPDNFNNILFGNPFNNEIFHDQQVMGDGKLLGRFSLIAPPSLDPGSGAGTDPYFGVVDESGKINPNALMRLDPTGQQLHDVLMKLPNMTEDIANNIVAWMGGAVGVQNGGAQNDYYTGLTPPYRCRYGMLDSVNELMLVKGVTRPLLFGTDDNRNGTDDEQSQNGFDRGWAAYLTVHSREQNRDVNGQPMVFLGNTDLQALAQSLTEVEVPEDMVKFILMYRKYGQASPSGGQQSLLNSAAAALGLSSQSNVITQPGDLSTYDASKILAGTKGKITSIFNLVGASVSIQTGTDKKTKKPIYTVYQSPLNDTGRVRDLLPQLFSVATVTEDVDLAPRVNVNTAPTPVLTALTALAPVPGNPALDDTDITKITAARPAWGEAPGDIFQTPAWLVTEAQIDPRKLAGLEKYITTRTQVYRVQSVGYFDGGKGPAVRVEAVIDTNNGRPRIIAFRDLSELGRGLNVTPNP